MTHEEEVAELTRVRERQHRMADIVTGHGGTLIEHALLIKQLQDAVENMRSQMATSEQLEAAVTLLTEKLQNIGTQTAEVKRGINWAVGLILAAVLIALLSLVVRSDSNGRSTQSDRPRPTVYAAGGA